MNIQTCVGEEKEIKGPITEVGPGGDFFFEERTNPKSVILRYFTSLNRNKTVDICKLGVNFAPIRSDFEDL